MKKKEYRIISKIDIWGDIVWVLQVKTSFLFFKYWGELSRSWRKGQMLEQMKYLESDPIYSENLINEINKEWKRD